MRNTSKQVPFMPWNLSQQSRLGWEKFHGGKGRERYVTLHTMETCPSVNVYTPVWMRLKQTNWTDQFAYSHVQLMFPSQAGR